MRVRELYKIVQKLEEVTARGIIKKKKKKAGRMQRDSSRVKIKTRTFRENISPALKTPVYASPPLSVSLNFTIITSPPFFVPFFFTLIKINYPFTLV